MLVCTHCGTLVEAVDLNYVTESHGERHRNTNCKCGGEFVPATKCKVCGEWFDNSVLYGVCECCLDEHETVETALIIGDANREDVGINSFIASILDHDKINAILEKYVEEHYTDGCREVVDFLEYDKSDFSDYIVEKVGE
jgi:hypothetical protein